MSASRWRAARSGLAALGAALSILLSAASASAATIAVTTTANNPNNDDDDEKVNEQLFEAESIRLTRNGRMVR